MQSQRIADIFSMFKNASKYNTAKPTDIHRLDPAEVSKVIGLFLLPILPIQKMDKQLTMIFFFHNRDV